LTSHVGRRGRGRRCLGRRAPRGTGCEGRGQITVQTPAPQVWRLEERARSRVLGGRVVAVACGQAGQGGAPLPRVPRAPRDGCEGRGQILRRRGVAGAWRPGQPRSSRGEPPDPTKGRSVCLPARRPRHRSPPSWRRSPPLPLTACAPKLGGRSQWLPSVAECSLVRDEATTEADGGDLRPS